MPKVFAPAMKKKLMKRLRLLLLKNPSITCRELHRKLVHSIRGLRISHATVYGLADKTGIWQRGIPGRKRRVTVHDEKEQACDDMRRTVFKFHRAFERARPFMVSRRKGLLRKLKPREVSIFVGIRTLVHLTAAQKREVHLTFAMRVTKGTKWPTCFIYPHQGLESMDSTYLSAIDEETSLEALGRNFGDFDLMHEWGNEFIACSETTKRFLRKNFAGVRKVPVFSLKELPKRLHGTDRIVHVVRKWLRCELMILGRKARHSGRALSLQEIRTSINDLFEHTFFGSRCEWADVVGTDFNSLEPHPQW